MNGLQNYFTNPRTIDIDGVDYELLMENYENDKITMMIVRKVVDTREEALKLRKALKNFGFDKEASFGKTDWFDPIALKTSIKYAVVAIHLFN